MSEPKITAIVGAMGSGKTEKLIKMYDACLKNGLKVGIFKPAIDTRSDMDRVVSRNGKTAPAKAITILDEILVDPTTDDYEVILIDEIQFFDQNDVTASLIAFTLMGIDVYVFGLDLTSEGVPFGKMGNILAVSHQVIKLEGKCSRCNNTARISHYKGQKDDIIKVGDLDEYEPLCNTCYYMVEKGVKKKAEEIVEQDLLAFFVKGEDFTIELVIPRADLEKAGYTPDDVNDICTLEGAKNLLNDLGIVDEAIEMHTIYDDYFDDYDDDWEDDGDDWDDEDYYDQDYDEDWDDE